jgi:site-specific DNA-methyltransferase (adenine-specific)
MISEVKLCDCMDYMREMPDNFINLALVDPPYGIGVNKMTLGNGKHKINRRLSDWDNAIPKKEYFNELFRVSKNQIIWGGNYFTEYLKPTSSWIFWDKQNGDNDFSDGEMAWSSFGGALRKISKTWIGANAKDECSRIHPTQKPIYIYKYCLLNNANPNDKILDTHLGSQSSRIAAYEMGFDFYGCEIDKDYFNDGNKRFENAIKQTSLFTFQEQTTIEQLKLL